MEILYLLIPMSAVLVLAIIGVFGWALWRGQFEDLEHEGERILLDDPPPESQVLPASASPPSTAVGDVTGAAAAANTSATTTATAKATSVANAAQSLTPPDAPLTPRPMGVAAPQHGATPLDADQVAAEDRPEQSRQAQQPS